MSNPAFLVDGQTEQRVISKICPNKPVQLINCNGDHVSIEAIGKRLITLINLFSNKYYPIVILMDREDRTESAEDMRDGIIEYLNTNLSSHQDIRIGIADRMIENWILADWDNIKKYVKPKRITKSRNSYEGTKGKAQLQKIVDGYHETTDGVNLLKSSNPTLLKTESSSFRLFSESLDDIECHWLNR